jgi:membrane protein
MGSSQHLSTSLERLLWPRDADKLPYWRRALLFIGRLLYAIVRDLVDGYLTLQATSLVYTTLLSLVPLLAVSFSVLKGFGVHNQIEPLLVQTLAPLGEQGKEIAARLIGFVDNTNVAVLGSVGLALLLYSVISLISKIEQVFNQIWHVPTRRPMVQRFSQYLSVLMVGPVLFFSAVGATASLRSYTVVQRALEIQVLGFLIENLGRLLPYLLITLAFTFVYVVVPYTKVRLRSALIGALVAGLLWQSIGQIFATFMAGSTKYAAIYSGLAIPILFMMWIYIAWLILLIGANIAFYHQYPEYLGSRTRDLRLSNRLRERMALVLAERIAERHYQAQPAYSAERLADAVAMPLTNVRQVLTILERGGVVVRTDHEPPRFVPAHAPEETEISTLLGFVRRWGEDDIGTQSPRSSPAVDALERRIDDAVDNALSRMNLRDLAETVTENGRPQQR